ncbi:hypothetical protein Tco_1074053 [Tanacetum coccineum]
MSNEAFINKFPNAHAKFLPYLISDHTPSILCIPTTFRKKRKAFRFSNFLTDKQELLPIFHEAEADEEKFLYQQTKIKWLSGGDKNTSYFHKVLKGRNNRSKVFNLNDDSGNNYNREQIPKVFLKHFEGFLGKSQSVKDIESCETLFHRRISTDVAQRMVKGISDKEIKNVMFDINDSKAPGPDGFTAAFFKKAWSIVGKDVCKAVKEFFNSGRMLGDLNATLISLVPKV